MNMTTKNSTKDTSKILIAYHANYIDGYTSAWA